MKKWLLILLAAPTFASATTPEPEPIDILDCLTNQYCTNINGFRFDDLNNDGVTDLVTRDGGKIQFWDGRDLPVLDLSQPTMPGGLFAHYSFDGPSPTDDQSPNGNHLNIGTLTTTPQGALGNAAQFSGNSNLQGSNISNNWGNSSLTVSVWVKPGNNTLNQHLRQGIVGVGSTSARSHFYFRGSSSSQNSGCDTNYHLALGADDGTTDSWHCSSDSSGKLTENVWQHVVGSYDHNSKTIRMYINANLVKEVVLSDNLTIAKQIQIGGDAYEDNWLTGEVDEVYLFNSVLSQSEVEYMCNLIPNHCTIN